MTYFSFCHCVSDDGRSATSTPTAFTPAGNFFLKYWRGPSNQPWRRGTGLNTLGRLLVVWSNTTDTSGTSGFSARSTPPKLSKVEKSPTRAASLDTASCVACLLPAPVQLSLPPATWISPPLIPPTELT